MKRMLVAALTATTFACLASTALASSGPSGGCRKNCSGGDVSAPVVRIDQPTAGSAISGTVSVSGTATDNVNVTRVDISIDGGKFLRAQGTSAWSYALNTSTLAEGGHRITVRATDRAGNATKTWIYVTSGGSAPSPSPSPSPTVSSSPTATPSPSPSPTPTTGPPPSSTTHLVTPEGVTIDVNSAGGWTAQQIYDMLKPSALQLSRIGPNLTIMVQDVYATQTTTSASSSGGVYTSFKATMYLKGIDSTFASQPDAQLAHEYGHAWTLYHLYMSHNGDWTTYLNARWTTTDGSTSLGGDARLDSSYSWNRAEIIADDYRLLFGSALAISQRPHHMNNYIPEPGDVPGLKAFLMDVWSP